MVFHDITRVKQLEEIRKEFVANVSHELRTPITTIRGFVETILEEEISDEVVLKDIHKKISRNAKRMENIIEDLLSLSRLEQESKLLWNKSAFTWEELTNRILANQERTTIPIEIIGDPQTTIFAYQNLLDQALSNLLENAQKYASESKKLVLYCTSYQDNIKIGVKDSGRGIPEEDQEKIFQRFYRRDKARSRQTGGTGLGLSIVKHIAMAHSGIAKVESTPGNGSDFYIFIPHKQA